jgi:predicted nucleotidyltransferase
VTEPRLLASLRQAQEALRSEGTRCALVGGLAVSARVEPRFTNDADFAVEVPDDANAERLIHALSARGYGIGMVLEHEGTGRLATVRLLPPDHGEGRPVVDVLFASCGIESEIVARAEDVALSDTLVVRVAVCGDLIAMKLLSRDDDRRPQDTVDLAGLIRNASDEDLATARSAAETIVSRGFDRGRDLVRDLEQAIARFGRPAPR